uniref:Putative secreted protein n=1 Tax=Amblyomma tuberculatum TaxID=48802 RepID=A0A6M2E3T9_9ACAR
MWRFATASAFAAPARTLACGCVYCASFWESWLKKQSRSFVSAASVRLVMELDSKTSSEETHNGLCNDDPLLLLFYVHKLVRVETTDGRVLAGYVKTIDPMSKSVVMVLIDSGRPSTVHVVMGHAVKSLTVVTGATPAEKRISSSSSYQHARS